MIFSLFAGSKPLPLFSIIIPTYNRPEKLADCLESLSGLDYPRDKFEVIVIDDGSDLPLNPIVTCFHDQLDVTLIRQSHAGPAKARNMGVKRAKGDFFAFIDDDCAPTTNWLRNLSALFLRDSHYAIGGRTINGLPNNLYSVASQTIIDVVYAYYNSDPDQACFFASNNLTVPAEPFRAIGGFNAAFTTSEDRDFCDRWLHHGYKMTYAPEVMLYHSHVLKCGTFWRQHFNYGRGAYRYHQARARRGTGRFRPDFKFYMGLILNPLMQEQKERVFWVKGLLVLSQVSNAIGFFWEGFNQIQKKYTSRL
jgi:glycosyltransferase involved in cell wall biosynthesis